MREFTNDWFQQTAETNFVNNLLPRKAQFKSAPDSMADTRDGDWLWASGSQLCMGARPIFEP
jgi:hypothetical protein